MSRINYINRVINDINGKELSEKEKEDAYNLTTNVLDSVEEDDKEKKSINAYLLLNHEYKNANLRLGKPVNECTSKDILDLIKKCRRNSGLGSVGKFEASDRIRNFTNRYVLADTMTKQLEQVRDKRENAIVDAFIGAAASDNKAIDDKKISYKNAVFNWIPYLTRLKNENNALYEQYKDKLDPVKFLKNMSANEFSADMCALEMLEIIEDTNMEEFAYTDNATFAADYAKKYEKLKALADGADIIDDIKSRNSNNFKSKREIQDGNADSSKVTEAKCRLAKELLKDYEARMRIIASPFYCIFAGKDFEGLSEKKIKSLQERATNPALKAYFGDVIKFKKAKENSFKGADITERLTTYITNIKPVPAPEIKLASDITMENMDKLIRIMYEDTKRASRYKKVRNVIGRYLKTTNTQEKNDLLSEVISASSTYLKERSQSSYAFRKERCERLIELSNQYKSQYEAEQLEIINSLQASIDREKELKNMASNMHSKVEGKLDSYKKMDEDEEKAAREIFKEEVEQRERERLAAEKARQEEEARLERERLAAERAKQEEEARLERERLSAEEKARLEAIEKEKARIAEEERKDRERREEELRLKAEKAGEDAAKWAVESKGKFDAMEARLIAVAMEARARRIKREHMERAIEKYEALGTIGKTYKDSEEARKIVMSFLDKYVFDKNEDLDNDYTKEALDSVPTAIIINAIKMHKDDVDKDNYADLVKADISKRIWDNAPTHEEMRKPMTDLINKKSKDVTELDRLNAFEYAVHVLTYASGVDTNFEGMKDADLADLVELGINYVNYDESSPDFSKNETFDYITFVQQQKHIDESAKLLAHFSKLDPDVYKYLPIEEISKYAEDAVAVMIEPDKQKEILDEAYNKSLEIKNRQEQLDAAINSGDKNKLISVIEEMTGAKQEDLLDIPTGDIVDLARRMYDKSSRKDEMVKAYEEYKKALVEREEDYYRELFLDLDEIERKEGLDEGEIIFKKENAYTYVKKALGMDVLPSESLDKLNNETLYKLISNIGVIKYLHDSVATLNSGKEGTIRVRETLSKLTDEQYETIGMNVDEYDKVVEELKSMELDAELKNGINNVLKPEVPYKKVSLFADVELTDKDIDINYASATGEAFAPYNNLADKKHQANISANKKNVNDKKKNTEHKEEKWEEDGGKLLDLISDIYQASSKHPLDVEMIAGSIKKNAGALAAFINAGRNGEIDSYKELISGLSEHEKVFIEGVKPILDDLAKSCLGKLKKNNNEAVTEDEVKASFKNNDLGINIPKTENTLSQIVSKGEPEIIKYMFEATDDCFDQIGGVGIPNIFNLDGDKKVDKANLEFAHNNLRYNKDAGQGKFLQTLMNDYYKDSNESDKRFMLSFIIKDFKKNDKGSTEKEKGGRYFASSLKGAGPVMQKMMQGVPEFMVSPELRPAINVVKSDLRPIDDGHVNQALTEIKTKCKKQITDIKIEKRLGAASVAETFLCTLNGPKMKNKEAVIKILRPDAKERMERELPLIKRSAIFADMPDNEVAKYKATIKDVNNIPHHKPRTTEAGFLAQLSEIEKEFNLQNEAKNCKTGQSKYGNKDENVKTVELIDAPTGENYLLMSKAEGKTLDRHIKESAELAESALKPFVSKGSKIQKIYKLNLDNIKDVDNAYESLKDNIYKSLKYGKYVGKVAKLWTGEALFGSAWNPLKNYNFRHGDLHSGNIMVDSKGATILDYGNASKLHHKKVTEIMKMMMTVVSKKPDLFVEALSELLKIAIKEDKSSKSPIGYEEISPEIKKKYIKELDKIFKSGSPEDAGIKILLALTKAQSLGIKLPAELQNFSQCQQRLENSMGEIKQVAMDVTSSLEKLIRMPVDESIINSCDPRVVFHRMMLEKDAKGNYKYSDPSELASMLLKNFDPEEVDAFTEAISPLIVKRMNGDDIKADVEKFRSKHYERYEELITSRIGKETFKVDTFPKRVEEWRKVYKKAQEEYAKDGKMSGKTQDQIALISGFILTTANTNGLLTEFESPQTIGDLNKKAFTPPFDALAFERLMAVFAADITMISTNVKELDGLIFDRKDNDKQLEEFEQLGGDAIENVTVSIYKKSRYMSNFVDKLRDTSKSEMFEKEMERLFKASPKFMEMYDEYKTTRQAYDKLTLENSSEEFVHLRNKMNILENKIVLSYSHECINTYKNLMMNMCNTPKVEDVRESSFLPDYVDVIYEVLMNNKASALNRLGTKYTAGVDLDDNEAEKSVEDKKKTEDKKEEKKEEKKEVKKEEKKDTKKADSKKVSKDNKKKGGKSKK